MQTSKNIGAMAMAVNMYRKGFGTSCAVYIANNASIEDYRIEGIEPTIECPKVTAAELQSMVQRLGIAHNYNKLYTPAEIKKIRNKRESGYTLKDLAAIYGVSSTTIRNYCLMPIFTKGLKTINF